MNISQTPDLDGAALYDVAIVGGGPAGLSQRQTVLDEALGMTGGSAAMARH